MTSDVTAAFSRRADAAAPATAATPTLVEATTLAVELARALTGASAAYVVRVRSTGPDLIAHSASADDADLQAIASFGQVTAQRAAAHGTRDGHADDAVAAPRPFGAALGVPVHVGGTVWGALAVCFRTGPAPAAATAPLAPLVRQLALTIEALGARSSRDVSHLERAQRIAGVGSWEHRLCDGRLIWSDEIFRMFGVSPDAFEATFDAFLACVHPDDRSLLLDAHERVMAGTTPLDVIHRIVRSDGAVRVVRERGELITEGDDVLVAGTVLDITDHAEAVRHLRESEERFREMAETIEDVFWTWDAREDRILYASPSYETVFGHSRAELYRDSRAFHRAIDPEDLPRLVEAATRDAYSINLEYRVVRPDGERRWIDVRTFPVRDSSGTVLRTVGIGRDITRLKTAEQALLRAQRIESIGTLAGGIAHDLNNVLTPIVMAANLLAANARHDADADLIETISTSAERGAAMVRQVLAFARGVDGQRVPLRVDHLVNDLARLIRDTFDRRIGLDVQVQPGLWSVDGDATQLHQVLLNLAVNARDAMPEGGQLRLDARNVRVDHARAATLPEGRAGRYVVLTVADTGSGIASALRDRVFDPFFTTKPQGQGTGLGLSTVQSLVQSHGGFIALDSEVGRGTTFTIYLPALDDAAAAARTDDVARVPRGGGRLVLVVDDEDAVRAVTRATLEMFDYDVVTAARGAEAVAMIEARADELGALVTDMMMPEVDGHAVIAAARRRRPDLPIVAASGLETPGMLEQMAAAGVRHFLAKPFTPDQLLRTVASAVAAAATPPAPPSAGG